jgi:rhodanese-related sulfurtransferase
MAAKISPAHLLVALHSARDDAPLLLDVRRAAAFRAADDLIPGALRRDPETIAQWAPALRAPRFAVAYCVHGHEVSQGVAQALCDQGIECRYLEHGIEGWRAAGGTFDSKRSGASTAWITRERPRIDRLACPWLIRRFIDADAEFHYVPAAEVLPAAAARAAIPFDVDGVQFGHHGSQCSFDAFIDAYRLRDEALSRLALIVRAADTGQPEAAPEAAGLLAISQGLSRNHLDDHAMLGHGMVMYDALYAACGGRSFAY